MRQLHKRLLVAMIVLTPAMANAQPVAHPTGPVVDIGGPVLFGAPCDRRSAPCGIGRCGCRDSPINLLGRGERYEADRLRRDGILHAERVARIGINPLPVNVIL